MTQSQPLPARTLGKSRFIAVLLAFVAVNLVVAYSVLAPQKQLNVEAIKNSESEARQQGKWMWWITRAFFSCPQPPDVVVLGSSQMGSASFSADVKTLNKDLDCVTHRRIVTLERGIKDRLGDKIAVFNFAMGGAMASDTFMIGRALFKGQYKPKMIVVGIGPRDFMDNTLPSASSTEPFQFFSPYVDIGALSAVAFPDIFGRVNFAIEKFLPLERIRNQVLALEEKLKQPASTNIAAQPKESGKHTQLLQAVSGTVSDVRPGEWVIPAWMPKLYKDNTYEYLRRYKSPNPPIYKAERAFFTQFLQDMQKAGIPVVIVGMPSQKINRDLLPNSFWTDFRSSMAKLAASHNATWIDLSDSPTFLTTDYLDTVHLDADGGRKLFTIIADQVTSRPLLAAQLSTQTTSCLLSNQPRSPKDASHRSTEASTQAAIWH